MNNEAPASEAKAAMSSKLETWKTIDVPTDRVRYEVSTYGNVRAVFEETGTVRYCRPSVTHTSGYRFVDIAVRGRTSGGRPRVKRYFLHRLVWEAFRGKIDGTTWVKHRDDDRSNNRLSNLQALPIGESRSYPCGEDNPGSRLTWTEVDEMRKLRVDGGLSYAELAKRFDVTHTAVYKIINDMAWRESTRQKAEKASSDA